MITLKRILVPLDGSPLSEQALPMATSLARQYKGRLILLRAAAPHLSVKYVTNPDALDLLARLTEQVQAEAERYLEEQQRHLRQQGCDVEIILTQEPPADAIIEMALAKKVDLIVMSTHGWGGALHWGAGSIADKVAHHSPCPVLLIRQGQQTSDRECPQLPGRVQVHHCKRRAVWTLPGSFAS